jgi:tetratricopeptide (TPR) repeat protein
MIIGVSGGVLILLLVLGGVFFLGRGKKSGSAGSARDATGTTLTEKETERKNTINLALEYLAAGEFQRALDLLDRLLIENPGDEEVRELRDRALREQRLASEAAAAALAPAPRQGSGDAGPQDQARRQAAEELRLEAEALAAAEAERQAAAGAEAARRKAQEEELARVSRELQAQMRAVNDLVSQGTEYLRKDDTSGAARVFAEVRSRMPAGETRFEAQKLADMAEAYYDYYSRHPNTNEGSEAARQVNALAGEASGKDPSQALPHYTLGKLNRDQRQWDKAAAELKEAVRLEPDNYLYSFDLGRVYFSSRNYTDARQSFENAVRLNARFEPAWYNLGGTLRALGRQNEALAAYRRAIAIKEDYAVAHREIGRILLAGGNNQGAVESFTKALQYSPHDLASLRELGAAQSAAGNFAAAEASFNRALLSASNDDQTNYNMAVVKIALNKNTEAVSFAKRAADGNPSNAVYAYTLGLACEAAEDLDGAIRAYAKAASLDAKYIRPRINLGSLYLTNGLPGEALQFLSEAYRAEPANFEVNNNMGAAYARQENWTASVEHYEKALAADFHNPTVHLNLARAYVGAGDLAKAKNGYQEVLRLSPDNWEALLELGKTCIGLGDSDMAKKYLQDLLKRNPSYSGRAEAERMLAGL